MKKKWLPVAGALLIGLSLQGQVQSVLPISTAKNGSLTAVAYDWEAIGVNPANLGWSDNHTFSFTILDMGLSGQSGGMSFPTLMGALESNSLISRANDWQRILGTSGGMNTVADINWFAFSFKVPGIRGAFAINMQDRIMSNAFLGSQASQALSNSNDRVYNDATTLALLNGTSLTYTHYREINMDYGVKLFDWNGDYDDNDPASAKCFSFTQSNFSSDSKTGIYGGIGLKYIWGIADINGGVENGALNAMYNINNDYPNIPSGFLNTPGQGAAIDLGLGVAYGHWKFGLSITDIGYIKWEHGVGTTTDTSVASITHGSDFINELKTGTLAGSTGQPDYETELQDKMRIGAAYTINSRALLSSDVIIPLVKDPDGLTGPYFALGCQVKTSKHIIISTGFTAVLNDGWGIPVGVTIKATSHIEFYLGAGDITSYLGKPNNANVSAAIGLFRFDL